MPNKKKLNAMVQVKTWLNTPTKSMRFEDALVLASTEASSRSKLTAIYILGQLVHQKPNNPTPWLMLLENQLALKKLDDACTTAHAMLDKFKDNESIYIACSSYYIAMNEHEKAMHLLNSALSQCKKKSPLHRSLGFIYTTLGEKTKASGAFEKALNFNHKDYPSYMGLARVQDKAEFSKKTGVIDTFLASSRVKPINKSYLYFARAWSLKDSNPDAYFECLDKANRLVETPYKDKIDKLTLSLEHQRSYFTHEYLQEYSANNIRPKTDSPPIFIAALPRSGTTLIEQILGAHSQTCGVGESSAFSYAQTETAIQRQTQAEVWHWPKKDLSSYLSTIDKYFHRHPLINQANGLRIVDKSMETYFQIGLILLAYPDAKIIHLQRHPLDIILSCYHQFFESGYDHLFNLEALAYYYNIFTEFMDFWTALFPTNILSISYEDVIAQQETKTKEILHFCDLPWEDRCLSFYEHVTKINTSSALQVRQPIYKGSVDQWKKFERQLEPASRILRY